MSHELTFNEFFPFIISGETVCIDFYSQACEPCQRFMKIIPRLLPQLEGKAAFGKVDVDNEPLFKQMYDLKKVPTFIFYKNGIEKQRIEGRIMTIKEIVETVDNLK